MDSDAFCFFFGFSTKSLKQRKNVQNKQKIHDLRNEKLGFRKMKYGKCRIFFKTNNIVD